MRFARGGIIGKKQFDFNPLKVFASFLQKAQSSKLNMAESCCPYYEVDSEARPCPYVVLWRGHDGFNCNDADLVSGDVLIVVPVPPASRMAAVMNVRTKMLYERLWSLAAVDMTCERLKRDCCIGALDEARAPGKKFEKVMRCLWDALGDCLHQYAHWAAADEEELHIGHHDIKALVLLINNRAIAHVKRLKEEVPDQVRDT